jgi:hypothetical protein
MFALKSRPRWRSGIAAPCSKAGLTSLTPSGACRSGHAHASVCCPARRLRRARPSGYGWNSDGACSADCRDSDSRHDTDCCCGHLGAGNGRPDLSLESRRSQDWRSDERDLRGHQGRCRQDNHGYHNRHRAGLHHDNPNERPDDTRELIRSRNAVSSCTPSASTMSVSSATDVVSSVFR